MPLHYHLEMLVLIDKCNYKTKNIQFFPDFIKRRMVQISTNCYKSILLRNLFIVIR